MEENLDKNNEVNKEISNNIIKSNSEETKGPKSEKVINMNRNNDEEIEPNVEIPPQRDIRETQPTISVNYRVVKNMNDNNLKKDQSYSNQDIKDDWDNADNDW